MGRRKVQQYYSNTATTDADVKSKLIDTTTEDSKIINGEIALVNTEGYEAIYHLNSDGTGLVQYLPISRITADKIKLNDYQISDKENMELEPTNEDTVSQAIGKLHKALIDDEYSMSMAMSRSNENLGFDENGNFDLSGTTYVSSSNTIVDAIKTLDSSISPDKMKLDGYVISDKINEELAPNSEDTITQAIGKLHKAIVDDETIVSEALTRSKESCGFDENGNLDLNGTTHLSGSSSIADALKTIDGKLIDEVSGENVKLTNYSMSDKKNAELSPITNDTVNQAIGKLHKAISDDELVISSALSRLNENCGFNENGNLDLSGTNFISTAKTIMDALKALDAKIAAISNV